MNLSRPVRSVLNVIGVIALVIGLVFAGQGAGLIPGSFMTGDRTWLIIGVILAGAGVVLLMFGTNRSKGSRG